MSATPTLKIFVTGATGYIGGSILSRLLTHPNRASFTISAIVRSAEKAKVFEEKFGVRAVVGSTGDAKLLEEEASNADVVIHTADSADDLPAAKSILAGAKKRHSVTGKAPILIHTSGTGVLTDDAGGEYAGGIVYSDLDIKTLKSIPEEAIHRNVDLTVLAADAEGYVRAHIVLPSTIYGLATGPLVDAGLANAHSVQVPSLIKASIDRGQAGVVGKGANIWPNVHITDIVELFIVLFDAVLKDPNSVGHGWEGFYLGENGEHELLDISKEVGKALLALGKAKTDEVTPFTDAELDKYYGGSKYMGTNSRAKADRARLLGWKPTKTTADLLKSVKPETEAILKSGNIGFGGKL